MLRHMFGGTRPIDWLILAVDALVLLVIVYDTLADALRRRRERKKQSMLNERVVPLSRLMDRGRRIQSIVPDPSITSEPRIIQNWVDSVGQWTEETNGILVANSAAASAAFLLTAHAEQMDTAVYSGGRQFFLTGAVKQPYQQLVVKLENLRRIIGRPEAYF